MTNEPVASDQSAKLSTTAHLMCAWPLVLVVIGGAIGGGLGGVAYGVNIAIYKSRMPVAAKVLLNLIAGAAAFIIWAVIAATVQSARS